MKIKTFYIFCIVLITTLACSFTAFPAPDPTAVPPPSSGPVSAPPTEVVFTPIPTFTATVEVPTATPASLSQSLKLASSPLSETGNGPVYTITAQVPYLQGADDPRVAAFNLALGQLAQNEVDKFRNDILANQPVVPFNAGSSFDLKYELIGQRGDIWSIKFDVMVYYDGAAHPGHYSITLNYDLAQGHEITLDDLFLHGVNHLQTISDYCNAELSKRDIGFTDPLLQGGADPLPENYQRWNLSNDGLVITFDEYQVAPYAAGPQIVIIPFDKLTPLASDGSALKVFSQ